MKSGETKLLNSPLSLPYDGTAPEGRLVVEETGVDVDVDDPATETPVDDGSTDPATETPVDDGTTDPAAEIPVIELTPDPVVPELEPVI